MRSVSIFAGSVYGNAQHVAEEVQGMLTDKGVESEVFTDPETSDLSEAEAVLVITSTTGQGDVPPNLEMFHSDLRSEFPLLDGKPFAVAALGDSSYGESFCGGGRQFQELLLELQGKPVAEMLEVDAIETLAAEDEVVPWVEKLVDALTVD
ncbi:flavodoxin domain-containing protein [Glaciecola sp. MH2013]|uniref:flavodoxin domain-containing protein n=1 Tax=Glaciecola sp. MH2013 TaxID=2785524 RepID=UPI0018A03035|nr:flavodoxin domain-containing protein [Glaciecola sp. MH2013]MBF7072264.1 flavodoxin domain-containing protein [Glaciecola sp. MH2013]